MRMMSSHRKRSPAVLHHEPISTVLTEWNHIRPALSDTLLFPAFYSHFTMSQIGQAEYDTDMSLEYDDKETYSHFLEFYRDIRYEFEACGRLTRLIVCCNSEAHLRGNVYVSYASERETMAAYLKFTGRFYAGKQLYCHFVTIPSWKSAICGLFFRKTCPKGDACNFLHIFRDPGPPFYEPAHNGHSTDVWRWSESPENEIEHDFSSKERKRRKERKRGLSREIGRSRSSERRKRSHSKERRRSRSSERTRRNRSSERRKRSKSREKRRNRSVERRKERKSKVQSCSSKEKDRNGEQKESRSERRRSVSKETKKLRSENTSERNSHSSSNEISSSYLKASNEKTD